MNIFLSYFSIFFGEGQSGAKMFLLALCSETIPSMLKGTLWGAGSQTQVGHMQDKDPTCSAIALSSPPSFLFLLGKFIF